MTIYDDEDDPRPPTDEEESKPLPARFHEPFKVYIGEELVSDPYASEEVQKKLAEKWKRMIGEAQLKRARESNQRKEQDDA
jgi:hypothetical protein